MGAFQDRTTAIYLAIWMVMNIATVILNKYLFQELHFNYPISLTIVHMVTCSVGSFLVLRTFNITPLQPVPLPDIGMRILPLAVLFCSNIVLGNVSLRWVPVSFMQTVKSSVPAFTVILQVLIFRKSFSRDTYLSVIPIVGGVVIASYTEANFNAMGFWSALVASIITALLAIVTSLLLTQKLDAINLLYYMAPLSATMLVPFAHHLEWHDMTTNWEHYGQMQPALILVISGCIAFLLNVTTFLVIRKTSALTYTVAGNFKVVFSIATSVAIFKNEIGIFNMVGCLVALLGVMWYNHIKLVESQQKQPAPIEKV